MLTTNSLSFILDEVTSAVAFESFFSETFMMPMLYDIRTSTRRRERLTSLGGIRAYEEKVRGARASEDSINQQFQKDFVHVSYGKEIPVERELVDDEEWGLLVDIGRQLGVMAAYTMEEKAAGVFNDAFAGSTYTSEDGLSLCNAAHVNVDSANSQSNTGTNSLNYSGVTTTRPLMRKFKNYEGNRTPSRPDLLLVPTDLEDEGLVVTLSEQQPGTTNNDINSARSKYEVLVWDFLTDTNAWFMLASSLMKMNLIWWQRIALEVFGDGNLFTGTRSIGGYFRASHGPRDWRWIYGNNPS